MRDLQLLVRPMGGEGGQQAVAIAVNAEHGVVRKGWSKTVPALLVSAGGW